MDCARVRLKFWGVRGSTPTPQIDNLNFGGNTSCIEIRTAQNDCVIFDAGSGIRALGQALMREAAGAPVNACIFLTHFHWDHIQGIPFFAPLYAPQNHVSFMSGATGLPLQETIEGQMAKPYFPIDFNQLAAKREFSEHTMGEAITHSCVTIHPFSLNHPQGPRDTELSATERSSFTPPTTNTAGLSSIKPFAITPRTPIS